MAASEWLREQQAWRQTHGWEDGDKYQACADELEADRRLDRALRLAKQAMNGWACFAKRKAEHDDIARLHREIDALSGATPATREG